jgi:hypothetical protein
MVAKRLPNKDDADAPLLLRFKSKGSAGKHERVQSLTDRLFITEIPRTVDEMQPLWP